MLFQPTLTLPLVPWGIPASNHTQTQTAIISPNHSHSIIKECLEVIGNRRPMKQDCFLSSVMTNATSWCFECWLPMLWHRIQQRIQQKFQRKTESLNSQPILSLSALVPTLKSLGKFTCFYNPVAKMHGITC